ncbi:hypothetical protein ACRQ5Q_13735 [Bradyrhizobium sp. PMVTL-01]|uniref:hypothetical protein n=1 Tax=Bradyrhizobium sp. PMVTL-01 TaxID=3434999 RepID=UPI003F6FC2E6
MAALAGIGFILGWKYGAAFAAILTRAIGDSDSSFMYLSRISRGSNAAISFGIIVGVMDGLKPGGLAGDRPEGLGKDAFGRDFFGNDGFGNEGFGSDGLGEARFGNDRFGTTNSSQQHEAYRAVVASVS